MTTGLVPGVYRSFVPPSPTATLLTGVPLFVGYGTPTPGVAATAVRRHRRALPSLRWRVAAPPASGAAPAWSRISPVYVLTQWAQFADGPGRFAPDRFLSAAVAGFFSSGGQQCQVVLLDQALAFQVEPADGPAVAFWQGALQSLIADVADLDLVCMPSLMLDPLTPGQPPLDADGAADDVYAIQAELLFACERRGDLFAILDPLAPPSRIGADTLASWVNQQLAALLAAVSRRDAAQLDGTRSGALYFPWVRPASGGADAAFLPPSGHVAAVYAVTDAQAGVQKSPANLALPALTDVQFALADADQAQLDSRVDCLRVFPNRGVVVWGARTLCATDAWTFIGVRRLFITVGRWLVLSTAWAVFEPNDLRLWLRLNRQLNVYLQGLYDQGALAGDSPADAYYVKCDSENNPPAQAGDGELVIEIGLRPAIPGEKLVLRLTQSTAGAAVAVGP